MCGVPARACPALLQYTRVECGLLYGLCSSKGIYETSVSSGTYLVLIPDSVSSSHTVVRDCMQHIAGSTFMNRQITTSPAIIIAAF
jgi:hypothetical protein